MLKFLPSQKKLNNIERHFVSPHKMSSKKSKSFIMVPGVGLEPTRDIIPADFKSASATNYDTRASFKAMAGIAPAYSGFADHRVSYFATWPLFILSYFSLPFN
jgi:hypothetical protein